MMRLAYVQVIPVSSRVGFQTAQKPHFQSGFTSLDSLYDNSEQIYVITSNSYPLLLKLSFARGSQSKQSWFKERVGSTGGELIVSVNR